jgi:uncharacterized protein YjaZ
MKRNTIILFLIGFVAIYLTSCDSCSRNKDKKYAIKADKIKEIRAKINTTIFRYEKDLFTVKLNDFPNELVRLQKTYSFFLNGDVRDPKNQQQLYSFITDPITKEIYQETIKQYPDVDGLKQQFDEAFSYYNYYFPNNKIPKVYTYVSSLDYELPIKFVDSVLVIALDMYLGKDCKYYKQIGVPIYKSERCSKEYIVADCLKEMAYSNMKFDNSHITLLDEMIMEGKRLYFAESMLPNEQDTILIGYPLEKLKWAQQNEANMWGYIIDKNMLYSPDTKIIMKFINDAPFTSFFKNDSPGRVGAWIGWQIVRAFMNNNKSATLVDMLNEPSSQKILNLSKYKPKKK